MDTYIFYITNNHLNCKKFSQLNKYGGKKQFSKKIELYVDSQDNENRHYWNTWRYYGFKASCIDVQRTDINKL